jgi:hypothetical protein
MTPQDTTAIATTTLCFVATLIVMLSVYRKEEKR